jgi:hypothetical protein
VLWVVLAGVLLVGGCGAVLATLGVRGYHAMDDAKSAVNVFLTAVEHGDVAAAQALLCDEARPDAVQLALDSHITDHRVVGVVVQSNSGFGSDRPAHTSAQVTVDVTLAGDVHHRDVVDVEHEHGRWLVCGVIRSEIRD